MSRLSQIQFQQVTFLLSAMFGHSLGPHSTKRNNISFYHRITRIFLKPGNFSICDLLTYLGFAGTSRSDQHKSVPDHSRLEQLDTLADESW